MFNSFYNKTENSIGVNNEITGVYNYSNAINTPYKSIWVHSFRFQTRINSIKMILKLDLDYTNAVFNNYISSVKNKATNMQYGIRPFLSSYFKDTWLNYEIGIDFEQNNSLFDLTGTENKGSKTSPFIKLKGVFSEYWSYSINNAKAYYKTLNIKRDFYQLDLELRHHQSKSKFSYWILGKNILNISNAQIVEAISSQNNISRNIIYRMPGYLGIGISYEF